MSKGEAQMSIIANRRALAVATQKIVKSTPSSLTPEDFAATCQALAQVFTDTYGMTCHIRIALPKSAVDAGLTVGNEEAK